MKAPPSMAGKKVKCSNCESVFVVPGKMPAPVQPNPNTASTYDDPLGLPSDGPTRFEDPLTLPGNDFGGPANSPFSSPACSSRNTATPGRRPPSTGENPLLLPAIFLIVLSSIWIVLVLVNFAKDMYIFSQLAAMPNAVINYNMLVTRIGLHLAFTLFSTAIIIGSTKMLRLSNYRSAVIASVIGMIPCCGGIIVLSIPFAIWAFVLLNDPAVKRRFKKK